MIIYRNHFNNKKTLPGGITENDYLEPDNSALPAMQAYNPPPNAGTAPSLTPSGLLKIETLSTNGSSSSQGATLASGVLTPLASSELLMAEVEFEQPSGPPGYKWAVVLFFTQFTGPNQSSKPNVDLTCVFDNDGKTVSLGHTGSVPMTLVDVDLSQFNIHPGYANFAFNGYRFKLVIRICRNSRVVKSTKLSVGELRINDVLVAGPFNLHTQADFVSGDPITAVGFAINSPTGSQVSADFRSFAVELAEECIAFPFIPKDIDLD